MTTQDAMKRLGAKLCDQCGRPTGSSGRIVANLETGQVTSRWCDDHCEEQWNVARARERKRR
jgi:hypothetical protein